MGLLRVSLPHPEMAAAESVVSVRTELRTEQPYGEPEAHTKIPGVCQPEYTQGSYPANTGRTNVRGQDPRAYGVFG